MNILQVEQLHVVYRAAATQWGRQRDVRAVAGVDLSVSAGQTVGLVGASGAGKTTLARAILHLVRAQRGHISVGGFDVTGFGRRAPVEFRKDVQMVFQRTASALNPAMTVGEILAEPVRLRLHLRGQGASTRAAELLATVGLPVAYASRKPHELSVGQRQRVAIARAFATEPKLIVLDEPVSALDATTRSQVVSTLEDLQRETAAAYVLITHDIALARHLCGRIAVMYRGRIVEEGPADRVCDHPQHPYTQLLIASVPEPDPTAQRKAREQRRRLASELATRSRM